jgi:rod shape determining protein RodA
MGVATATFVESFRARDWRHFDVQLLLYVLLLIAIGLAIGYSTEFNAPERAGMSETSKTLIWATIGLTLFFVAASVDYAWLRTLVVPIYGVVIGLLVLTSLIGTSLFGAQMSVTVAGLDFQFSEVSKVLMITVLATYLAGRRERVGRLSTILVAGALMAIPTYLVYEQPDLGTALVFIAILGGMLFMAGASLGWLGLMIGGVIAVAPIAVGMLADYQRQRLFCFLDPYADPQGACYQLVQSLNAVGSGGWMGRGLTVGGEELRSYLPVQSSDFIFAVLAEDLGFVGGMLLLVLFGLLLWRILLIGWGARDAMGMLIAAGIASLVLFQVVVNVGMAIGVMPVTGIPLPLVSYGGSSMVSLLFGLGILESVRMRSHKPTL